MHIGLLTTSFPRGPEDVPGIFVLGFARSLVALGHRVHVLAPAPGDARFLEPPRYDGIEVSWVSYLWPRTLQRTFYGAGVLDNLRSSKRAWLGPAPFSASLFAHAAREVGPWDALVSHWALPCALIAGSVRGQRPHLAVLHSADVFLLERLPMRTTLARRIFRGASALLCSSRDVRRRVLALVPPIERAEVASRVHVCAMGIDAPDAPRANRALLREELAFADFTVLCLCRLIPLKGLEDAIDAAAQIDATLVIAGDGPHRAALERYAAVRGARVRFLGEVHGARKSALFYAADVFVSASIIAPSGRTEGMPTTILEAMAHALPVVATDVGGVRDVLIHEENGLIAAPNAPDLLARAIARLRDPALARALSRAGRARAQAYTWDELGPHFAALLAADSAPA